jgi:hypothetical protein
MNPCALVVAEDEGFVLLDRSTRCEAELVLAELSFRYPGRVVEEVCGVELVIAEKLPQVPVKLVGSTLQSGVQRRTARAPELRAVIGGLHFELGDRVYRR